MARPPLPLGTNGEIRCDQLAARRWRARTYYRDYDGVARLVERRGPSKARALERLRAALRDRPRVVVNDEIGASSRIRSVAKIWLRELDESNKATRTKKTYRDSWEKHLSCAVGALRGNEVTVSLATHILRTVHESHGAGSAKHAKVVLGGIMGLYVRHDAIEVNPIREVVLPQTDGRNPKKERMRLEPHELPALRRLFLDDEKAKRLDLIGVINGLAAMGCRIGELLALDWDKVNLDCGTVAIEGTVIRIKGAGLVVQPHTKSDAGMRTIAVPGWYVDMLRDRSKDVTSQWVYPSTRGTLRDPDNTRGQLREVVDGSPWEGLHPHAFRHLVATCLDGAGLSAREIADYLGHERVSMTQDVYMNRKTKGDAAAHALSRMELGE